MLSRGAPVVPASSISVRRQGRRVRRTRVVAKFDSQNLPLDFAVQNRVQSAGNSVFHALKHFRKIHTPEEGQVTLVPLTVQRNGQRLQYVWKGERLQTIAQRVHESSLTGVEHAWRRMSFERGRLFVVNSLFPDSMTVSSDYWEWVSWRLCCRFFGTCLTVFGTQSLLMAAGLNAKTSLTASVAINWMVKDGLGRIARLMIATKFSQKFDTNIKKARFISTLVHTACMAGEYLTPVFPNYFLLLAAISNFGKAVMITAFVSTAPSLSIVFAKSHTVCDITAKTQAQYSVVDSSAIAVAASLTHLCRASPRALFILPLVAYFLCSFGSIFGMYKENKALVFRTLNVHRMNIVTRHWIQSHSALAPEKVCGMESALGRCVNDDRSEAAVKMGRIEDMADCPSELESILELHRDDAFIVSVNRSQLRENPHARPALLIAFQDRPKSNDIALAFLTGGYAREKLRQSRENIFDRHGVSQLIEQARDKAKASVADFVHALESVGWKMQDISIQTNEVLYSTTNPL